MSIDITYAPYPDPNTPQTITVTSPDIKAGASIGLEFAMESIGGQNRQPVIEWDNVPTETKSFAITCFDPNAPTGSGFWHWIATDIDASKRSFKPGDTAREFLNDYGFTSWGGMQPPAGPAHNYIFTVFALPTEKLALPQEASAAFARFTLECTALARGSFGGTFGLDGQ